MECEENIAMEKKETIISAEYTYNEPIPSLPKSSLLNEFLVGGWTFEKRTRRPPEDHINALMSLTYTMINNEVQSGLRQYNLDPFLGIMHADRHGRPALALDLKEEFRAIFADEEYHRKH